MKKKTTAPVSTQKTLLGKPLPKEHAKFHQDHPNADTLIKMFLISFVILVITYMSKMM